MINDEMLKKFDSLMNGNEVLFLKGQLRNIQQRKKDNQEIFYVADLRVPRNLSIDDIYSVSFNTYHLCFSNNFITNSKFTIEDAKSFKDNEVLVNLSTQSNIRTSQKDGVENKFNNTKYFVNDLMFVKAIDKPNYLDKKIVNI